MGIKPETCRLGIESTNRYNHPADKLDYQFGKCLNKIDPAGTLLSIINAMDWKMPLEESLKAARIHDQLSETTLYELVPGWCLAEYINL